MKRSVVAIAGFLAGLLACTTASADRGPGWEFGADIIYQLSQDIDFKGGSQASLDDDWGLTVNFGYRFSNKLELQFGLDWSDVDYDAELQTAINNVPAGVVSVRGTAESFTPRVSVHYNFTEGDIAPFRKAVEGAWHGGGPWVIVARVTGETEPVGPKLMDGRENKYRFVRYVEETEGITILKPSIVGRSE